MSSSGSSDDEFETIIDRGLPDQFGLDIEIRACDDLAAQQRSELASGIRSGETERAFKALGYCSCGDCDGVGCDCDCGHPARGAAADCGGEFGWEAANRRIRFNAARLTLSDNPVEVEGALRALRVAGLFRCAIDCDNAGCGCTCGHPGQRRVTA